MSKIEVIRKYIENDTDFEKIWKPIIDETGMFEDDTIKEEIYRYAHFHSLIESQTGNSQFAATAQNPLAGRTVLPNPVPNPTIVSLPLCLRILSRLDFSNKTLYAVDSPAFITLVGDTQRFVEVPGESFFFEFPDMIFSDIQTNLPDIYEERMIQKFADDIEEYMSNADVIFLYNMQVDWWVDNGGLNRSGKIMLKLRMKAVNEEEFINSKPEPRKAIITSTPSGSTTWNIGVAQPSIFLKEEPTKFQRFIAKLFFRGSSIHLPNDKKEA